MRTPYIEHLLYFTRLYIQKHQKISQLSSFLPSFLASWFLLSLLFSLSWSEVMEFYQAGHPLLPSCFPTISFPFSCFSFLLSFLSPFLSFLTWQWNQQRFVCVYFLHCDITILTKWFAFFLPSLAVCSVSPHVVISKFPAKPLSWTL